MTVKQKVKQKDRMGLVTQYAQIIKIGEVPIDHFDGLVSEIAECKRHFSDFYGDSTHEHELTHSVLNIMLMMERSIEKQGEDPNTKIKQWIKGSLLRTQLTEKIKKLTS